MLIGIDASRANRKYKTGTEWYSYHLIKNIAKLDSENEYILYTDKVLDNKLFNLCDTNDECCEEIKFDKDGYQIIKSPHNNFKAKVLKWPFSYFWTLGRLTLEMIFHKPDVLFIPAHTMPLIFPRKTINTIHDVAFRKEKQIYRNEKLGPKQEVSRMIISAIIRIITLNKYSGTSADYLNWSTLFALKHAWKIITVSNSTKKDVLDIFKQNYNKEKIYVVYNGVDKDIYRKIDNKEKINLVLEKYGIDKPYLLYVGRLEKKKNTPILIESFAKVKNDNPNIKEKLVLIGNAGFGFDDVIYNIAQFDMSSHVEIPGWVNEEDMPYLYNGASAFIFPSKYEGFGIPILQAFVCGTPVILSDIDVMREIAKDAGLYFDPYSANSISSAISRVLSDRELRERLVKNGKQVVKQYSWEKCAKETLEILIKS